MKIRFVKTPVKLPCVTITIGKHITRFNQIEQLNPIPTDCIIDKTLPGLGATYTEITAKRNSILILPNVATIISKHEQHQFSDNTFAVYEGVTQQSLVTYLKSNTPFKKLLTTPEGFVQKVKPALDEVMYNDYFLLLDESHKYITDAGYRKEIILPMDDFFMFKNKAMITSTLLMPSDKRFEEQKFKHYKVRPTYHHKVNIEVVRTDNPLHHLLCYFHEHPSDNYCIFFNSIQGITSTIESMKNVLGEDKVDGKYRIFCSRESTKELKIKGYTESYDVYQPGAKYNFFTSSFNNGLDITYAGLNVEVIMITDIGFADHSAVNPGTDAVQIRGRFRPYEQDGKLVDWVSNFVHIVKTNRTLPFLSKEEAVTKIEHSKDFYNHIREYWLSTSLTITQEELNAVLARVSPYANLINKDISLNPYKVDNYLYKEQVRSYYRNSKSLESAYEQSKRFNVIYKEAKYRQKDLEKLKYTSGKYSPENWRDVTNILWECEATPTYYPTQLTIRYLNQHFSLMVRAYYTISIENIYKLGFDHSLIMKVLAYADALLGRNQFPVIDAVHGAFSAGRVYLVSEIKRILQEIFDLYEVVRKADATDIKMYFDADECQHERQRAYKILRVNKNSMYSRV